MQAVCANVPLCAQMNTETQRNKVPERKERKREIEKHRNRDRDRDRERERERERERWGGGDAPSVESLTSKIS